MSDINELWPVDGEYAGLYHEKCIRGRDIASRASCNIVAIARNAMPALVDTLERIEQVADGFRGAANSVFVFENDSSDGTPQVLGAWGAKQNINRLWRETRHEKWGVPDARNEFAGPRTERLARARNICLDWARQREYREYTIVIDVDPAKGFDVNGIFNSIAWLNETGSHHGRRAGAMAAYSLYRITNEDGTVGIAHYDAWAARLNFWRDRKAEPGGMAWFSTLLPPVGSPPIPMNSAFGGICVYRTAAFLSGGYSGEDCEHVPHHRRRQLAGWQLYLNPGCRYIAIWQ